MTSWRAGLPLELVELPSPEPRAREVRVAVHAIGVNPVDWKMRQRGPLRLAARAIRPFRGPRGPVIVGVDFAGVVEAVGPGVTHVALGERVVGGTNFSRGQHGSYADTVVVREDQVAGIPATMAFDVAGALPVAGVTAWKALHEFRPTGAHSRVLVLGASGGVGQLAIQIARQVCGAAQVVGVCSGRNVALVEGLGAHVAVDYGAGDPLAQARAHGPYDVIVDCVGSYPARRCRSLLGGGGRHVMVAGDGAGAMLQTLVPPFRSRAILGTPDAAHLAPLVAAVAAGKVKVTIAARLPLADAERAHEESRTGRTTGKLVLLAR
ncbi:MAG: NAD(P)-dependent alcohol dehydrogenase [Kofleriaceae bacterium]